MSSQSIRKISVEGIDLIDLLGQHDTHLRLIENQFSSKVVVRGDTITIKGEPKEVEIIAQLFKDLILLLRDGQRIHPQEIEYRLEILKDKKKLKLTDLYDGTGIILSTPKYQVKPKTLGQYRYIEAIREYDIVIGIGPAGTGKTYLAVAMAVSALQKKEISRIILVRPAVEAGENLGYLPGDFKEKVDPYLRPLYDALYEMMPPEKVRKYLDTGVVEVAPLAYMRGRTLNSSFVILDEAQNTTSGQMKMFLTRLGFNSKAVITGDITQVDLPKPEHSGLIQVQTILAGIEGIKFIYFTEKDTVRHRLVQEIIKAYKNSESMT